MKLLVITLLSVGCSQSDRVATSVSGSAQVSLPVHVADCPEHVEVDCDKLVPIAIRDELFGGASGKRERSHTCVWGTPGESESVEVRASHGAIDFVTEMRSQAGAIDGLGRAAYAVAGDVRFIPTSLDCEVHVHWQNDQARATALARALDAVLTKDSITK